MKTKNLTKAKVLDNSYRNISDNMYKYIEEKTKPINERHKYIVSYILNVLGVKYKSIYCNFGLLDNLGMIDDGCDIYYDFQYASIKDSRNRKYLNLKINKEEYFLEERYPSRWLFEDFEEELLAAKAEFDKEEQKEKEQVANKKKQLQSLKKKLTKEEFELLAKNIK